MPDGIQNLQNRTIFCHDNLEILQGINSNSIDLIYLDPPFNSDKNYTAPIGSSAEGASFKDIFRDEDLKDEWLQTIKEDNDKLYLLLENIKNIEGEKIKSTNNFCYLSYLAIRLIEMYRILKDTGSIYLHCDPTMSHYLKLLMDIIFSEKNYKNEINWCYNRFSRNVKKAFPSMDDIILFYTKTDKSNFNKLFTNYRDTKRLEKGYHTLVDNGIKKLLVYDKKKSRNKIEQATKENYKIVYTEAKKPAISNIWDDISIINSQAKERTGYPTQKPLALLERIIQASSNEGDVVLDPFCGCATTCVAAEKLNRRWIGIDVSVKAYDLVRERLQKNVADPEKLTEYQNKINYFTDPPKRTDLNGDDSFLKKHVYIISHPNYSKDNLYKVGIASNLNSRLNSYQTSDPLRQYKVEFSKITQFFRETESYIHKNFFFSHEWVKGKLEDIIKAIEEFDIDEYND